jgi:hypothetical protein
MVHYHTIANDFLSGLLLITLPILWMNSEKKHFTTGTMIKQSILDVNANYAITPKIQVICRGKQFAEPAIVLLPGHKFQVNAGRILQRAFSVWCKN